MDVFCLAFKAAFIGQLQLQSKLSCSYSYVFMHIHVASKAFSGNLWQAKKYYL